MMEVDVVDYLQTLNNIYKKKLKIHVLSFFNEETIMLKTRESQSTTYKIRYAKSSYFGNQAPSGFLLGRIITYF